jgi:hypothetical protein
LDISFAFAMLAVMKICSSRSHHFSIKHFLIHLISLTIMIKVKTAKPTVCSVKQK